MNRRTLNRFLAVLPALAAAVAAPGCSMLYTVAYLVRPADVPAEFTGLRGKHVAVVCRPIVELEFSDANSARELAALVGAQIARHVRGVRVIEQQEVARWLDEHAWVDYPTLGRSIDADVVVGVDLEQFRMHEGSTLYRGQATTRLRVFEAEKGTVLFEKRIDGFNYPANSAVPVSDHTEPQFRGLFLNILARRIASSFHAYESQERFAEENLTF